MFIGLTLPVFILGSLALALADYLWRLIKPPVPPTVPLSEPYTPPFLGGQCVDIVYVIVYKADWLAGYEGEPPFTATSEIRGALSFENFTYSGGGQNYSAIRTLSNGVSRSTFAANDASQGKPYVVSINRKDNLADNCGNLPNPNPTLPIGGNGLPSSPSPVLYPPPNTPNNNFFPLIAGLAAVAATALTAATAAAAATAATAVTAATAAATAATAAIASAPSGSTTQQQAQSQKLSADALIGIAQVLAEVAKQIAELEKEVRKLKTDEAKKEKDEAKKIIRYDFGSANRDGFIKLYPDSNPDSYEATFIDVQIFNIPIGSGKYFGDKSPHFYKYQSLGQIHFVSPTFGILESREVDFARLSLNIPDNCFGFFYHFGLNGIISANLSAFYSKTEEQVV